MPKTPPQTLALDNAAIGYHKNAAPVLRSIGLTLRPGEFVGVIGPNGSGKSTLVRTLSRVLAPLAGTTLLGGQDLYAQVSARQSAQQIGVVPQSASALLEFTVRDIVEMGRAPHLAPGPFSSLSADDTRIVDEALRAAGVTEMARRLAPTLSGGEWQRVQLARALAQSADFLLLDEPTAHLDLQHQRQVLSLARSLAHTQNKAVLAVLHDLNLAAEFCDRLLLVHAGSIVAEGAPADVLTEANLAAVYQSPVWVRAHPLTGRPLLLPLPDSPPPESRTPLPPSASPLPIRRALHVVCGAGSGAGLLPALHQSQWHITCDALTEGDPDADLCRLFAIPFAAVPPFTIPPEDAWQQGRRYALSAQAVVIAPVPFGPLNTPALVHACDAQTQGIPVFHVQPPPNHPHAPMQETIAELWNTLLRAGMTSVPDPRSLLRALETHTWKP